MLLFFSLSFNNRNGSDFYVLYTMSIQMWRFGVILRLPQEHLGGEEGC